jgi:Carboxypeptidase regulatory-like domain/TonB-dependent Receptor Plug Domain
MQIRYFLAAGVAALSIGTITATPAMAQETTSSVRGTVEGPTGPVAGASVTIVHEPSGTTSSSTTNADGSFSANGLRVGGPYTVTVDADGFEQGRVTDLSLQAGQAFRLPIALQEQTGIIVTAASIKGATETSTGPITALSRDDIEGAASINRDIRDLARRDPLVTMDLSNARTIEIAGNNGRLNRFSVDGVQFSDDFGLNNGGLPTSRGPVPFDAIEQFSVKTAPYDVSEGDFQGGAINVIIRSGSNKFGGRGFFSYTDDSLTGDTVRGRAISLGFDSKQYGGTVWGPIVKDKLFFMLSYEKTEEKDPFDDGVGPGYANQVPNLTTTQIDNISSIAQSVYNIDTLGQITNAIEEDEKMIAKLDWNATDDHRVALTFIRNVGNQQFQQNTFTTVNSPSLGLFSNGYELTEEVNAGTLQLNSNWSDNFSTEIRASYRDVNRGQEPFGGRNNAQYTVCLDAASVGSTTACTNTVPTVVFGPDVSRHSNALNTSNTSVDFTARLEAGDHSLKFTAGFTDVDVFNLFLQRSLGDLYFDSITDFQNRRASRLRLANAVPSLDPNDAGATFGTQNVTVGLQDDWQATENLQLNFGVRADIFNNDTYPALNPNFVNRYGFSNRETFTGQVVIQPRFGFNWKASDRLIVRGGAGIFSGGTPDVFVSNSFSNTGLLTNAIDIQRNTSAAGCNVPTNTGLSAAQQLAICNGALIGVTGVTYPTTVTDFLATNTASLASAPTNAIDPNLKIARKMKASLQVDYDANLGPLGDGWLIGAQLLYDKNVYGYTWRDIRTTPVGTLPDGRTRFNGLIAGNTNQDLLMINSTRGRGIFTSLRVSKDWDFGFSLSTSYTRANVKDENAITSATANSLFSNNAFLDGYRPAYGRSVYEIKDTWKFDMDWRHDFFGDNTTRVSLFGEWRSGRPYSLTMGDNVGGRSVVFGGVGNVGRQLLYVPTAGDTRVSFDTPASEALFNQIVTNYGLDKYRGKVIAKNSQRSPSFLKLDLHAEQEIPFVFGGKLKVFGDIENFLNLIDSDLSSLRQISFPYTFRTAQAVCLSTPVATGTAPTAAQINTAQTQTCAQYRYSNIAAPNASLTTSSRQSLYAIRVGVKVSF